MFYHRQSQISFYNVNIYTMHRYLSRCWLTEFVLIWKSIKTPTPTFVSQFCSAKFVHIRNASRNLSFVNLFGIFAPKWFSIFCILHQNYYWLFVFCIPISSESLSHPFEVKRISINLCNAWLGGERWGGGTPGRRGVCRGWERSPRGQG